MACGLGRREREPGGHPRARALRDSSGAAEGTPSGEGREHRGAWPRAGRRRSGDVEKEDPLPAPAPAPGVREQRRAQQEGGTATASCSQLQRTHLEPVVLRLGIGLGFPLFLPPADFHASAPSGVENDTIKIAMIGRSAKGEPMGKTRSSEVVSFPSPRMFQPSILVMLSGWLTRPLMHQVGGWTK